ANEWRRTPVGVDTFDQETVDDVGRARDLAAGQVACLPYDPAQSVDEIVDFHRKHLDRSGGRYVISLRTAVTARLSAMVPVLSGTPGPATIRAQLHELALRIQSKRATALRFAAGVFVVVGNDAAADLNRSRVGLMNLLVNTPEFADAWIENRDRRGVGLRPPTLSRLAAVEGGLEGRPISPSDLAKALGITEPSGRRLIRKLSEHGLVVDEGSAQVHRKGRPTRLYRLAIAAAIRG